MAAPQEYTAHYIVLGVKYVILYNNVCTMQNIYMYYAEKLIIMCTCTC